MGQGTDSLGGYEAVYDPYSEGLESGMWTQRDGTEISVTKMSLSHLRNAQRAAQSAANRASYSCDEETLMEWVDVFQGEIDSRVSVISHSSKSRPAPRAPRGEKRKMICHCGAKYSARVADLKRGWALSCSKSCAAIRRDYGRPAARAAKTNGR